MSQLVRNKFINETDSYPISESGVPDLSYLGWLERVAEEKFASDRSEEIAFLEKLDLDVIQVILSQKATSDLTQTINERIAKLRAAEKMLEENKS
jgi:hypothetical protein